MVVMTCLVTVSVTVILSGRGSPESEVVVGHSLHNPITPPRALEQGSKREILKRGPPHLKNRASEKKIFSEKKILVVVAVVALLERRVAQEHGAVPMVRFGGQRLREQIGGHGFGVQVLDVQNAILD